MRGGVVIRHLVVDRVLRFERERVVVEPSPRPQSLKHASTVDIGQAEKPAELLHDGTWLER